MLTATGTSVVTNGAPGVGVNRKVAPEISRVLLNPSICRVNVPVPSCAVPALITGTLREIAVDGSKTFFDTNTSEHHHFLVEETNALFDIPGSHIEVGRLPDAPAGMQIARVDVIVRVRRAG